MRGGGVGGGDAGGAWAAAANASVSADWSSSSLAYRSRSGVARRLKGGGPSAMSSSMTKAMSRHPQAGWDTQMVCNPFAPEKVRVAVLFPSVCNGMQRQVTVWRRRLNPVGITVCNGI